MLVPASNPRVARALPPVTPTAELAEPEFEMITNRLVVVSYVTATLLPAAVRVASALNWV